MRCHNEKAFMRETTFENIGHGRIIINDQDTLHSLSPPLDAWRDKSSFAFSENPTITTCTTRLYSCQACHKAITILSQPPCPFLTNAPPRDTERTEHKKSSIDI